MDNITVNTLRDLKAVGFSYPEYEHELNFGMLYFYHDDEYQIGGFCPDDFTEQDRIVAQQGEWLPDSSQLLEWLGNTDFSVNILMDDVHHFSVQATDTLNGLVYTGGGYGLANALAKVILKICKSKKREYIPRTTLRLQIIYEE